jgi:hypothetical protein
MEKYNNICNEYIYLVREREHVLLENECYKIGKTKQEGIKRLNNYNSGTELILQLKVNNCDVMEKKIIELFKTKYKLFEGNETFIGNVELMKEDIWQLCKNTEKIEIAEKNIKEITEERIKREKDKIQNIISLFVNEKIIKTNNPKDKIGKRGLLEEFKFWFMQSYGSEKAPKSDEIFEYMNINFGQVKINGWYGVKFVWIGEEEDDIIAEM